MAAIALTGPQIDHLMVCPKRITNPSAKSRQEERHVRRDFHAVSLDGEHEFTVFTRQSTLIPENFTAGLRWHSRTGEQVILMRCNGLDHPHSNPIERQQLDMGAHVHIATERYIVTGRKAETFAEPSTAYRTLDGALHELVTRTNITGLTTKPDQPELF